MLASNGDRHLHVDGGATLIEHYGYDQFNNGAYANRLAGQPLPQYDDAHPADWDPEQVRTRATGLPPFITTTTAIWTQKSGGRVTRTFTYDALERLQQVDGSGISTKPPPWIGWTPHIAKTVGGGTTNHSYSGISIWSEFNADWSQALAYYNYTGVDEAIIRSTPCSGDPLLQRRAGFGGGGIHTLARSSDGLLR